MRTFACNHDSNTFGWYCARPPHEGGPCADVPRWWNWSRLARAARRARVR